MASSTKTRGTLRRMIVFLLAIVLVAGGIFCGLPQKADAAVYPTGKLKVTKIVEGDVADPDQSFDFTVTLTDGYGGPLVGASIFYGVYVEDTANTPYKKTDANGQATVSLKNGESLWTLALARVGNQPYFTVEEADYSEEGFTFEWTNVAGDTKDVTLQDRSASGRLYQAEGGLAGRVELTATNTMAPPELSVTKTSDVKEAKVGDMVPFTITVDNKGGYAKDVKVTDLLPDELEYVSDDSNGTAGSGQVDWTINVPAKKSVTITINTKVKEGAEGKVINKVRIQGKDKEVLDEESILVKGAEDEVTNQEETTTDNEEAAPDNEEEIIPDDEDNDESVQSASTKKTTPSTKTVVKSTPARVVKTGDEEAAPLMAVSMILIALCMGLFAARGLRRQK